MKRIDRYIIWSFLINYLLALSVQVGMYILLDIIVNFDLFTRGATYIHTGLFSAAAGLLGEIISFYMYRTLVIFQMMSGVIPLLAAGFTMIRMTRHRELTALLASGVSLYRIAAPVILCAIGFTLLVVLDQEVLMPGNINQLLRKHGQVTAAFVQNEPIYFIPESDHSLVLATSYDPATKTLRNVRIIERTAAGVPTARILAKKAVWEADAGEGPMRGGWLMSDVLQINDRKAGDPRRHPQLVKQMIYYTPLNPEQLKLMFEKKAVDYLSTAQINRMIIFSPPSTRVALEKIMYTRISQLIMNMVMLLIGIPFLLTREPGALVKNMFLCSMASGVCFVTTFVMYQLAGSGLSPFAGAAAPVILFGPLAIVMLDTLRT